MYRLAFLDDGRGKNITAKKTPLIPELGHDIQENKFNSTVVDVIAQKLKPLGIIPILVTPTDGDAPMKEGTDFANETYQEYQEKYGAQNVSAVYVSVHYDAVSHTWNAGEGITIFVQPEQLDKDAGILAKKMASFLTQGTKQPYRGIKEQNFHVLRETYMPAVLIENGFISSEWESLLMFNKNFQLEAATAHAKAICEYFNVVYQGDSNPFTP